MAEKNKPASKTLQQVKSAANSPPAKPQKKNYSFNVLLIFILTAGILGVGFLAGVFLNIIDVQKLGHTYKLYDYPVVGKYFTKPQTNFETIPLDEHSTKEQDSFNAPIITPSTQPSVTEKKAADNTDLMQEMKAKQIDEQKRIAKLSRLYGAMKPDEAVAIMNQLDDETVLAIFSRMEEEQVSRILAVFDAKRAARLTQQMIKSKPAAISKI